MLEFTSGEVFGDGEEITSMGAAYRNLLGYLPQDFGYYPEYTAKELLEVTGLGDAAGKKVKTFSGGMK